MIQMNKCYVCGSTKIRNERCIDGESKCLECSSVLKERGVKYTEVPLSEKDLKAIVFSLKITVDGTRKQMQNEKDDLLKAFIKKGFNSQRDALRKLENLV